MEACTVTTVAGLPSVRVLAESFTRHHPGRVLTVLVADDVDGSVDAREEPFTVLRPADLALDAAELGRLAMVHEAAGLVDALVPWALLALLDRGATSVVYLAPEAEVFGALDELGQLAETHGTVLVARSDTPLPSDGREPDDDALRSHGPYARSPLAVGSGAGGFLRWWAHDRPEVAGSLDLAPALFGAHVVRDAAFGGSVWALASHELGLADAGYTMGGRTLRCFDFDGLRPGTPLPAPDVTEHRPRTLGSADPVFARLCRERVERLLAAGWVEDGPRYGFDHLGNGEPITPRMRAIYAEALQRGDATVPGPVFDRAEADAFLAWLAEPVYPPPQPVLSRYFEHVYRERPDLRNEFPGPAGRAAEELLDWFDLTVASDPASFPECVRDTRAARALITERRRRLATRWTSHQGVNLIGYLHAVLGIGEVARALSGVLERQGIPVAGTSHGFTDSEQSIAFDASRELDAPFDVNLLCVNADMTEHLAEQLGPEPFAGRHTVGLWFWEVEQFPERMRRALELVDEVWVASEFTRAAIAAVSAKPVSVVPVPVPVPPPSPVSRAELGLPGDRVIFYYAFDYLSVFERKNPLGLIEAFTRAFAPDDGAFLLLKSINGDKRAEQHERVMLAAGGRPDILVLDRYLPPDHQQALTALCDAYVSLHRSEGFGLTMAEAMALGKPVIATGYSGNLDFMGEDTAFLVDYELRPVGPGSEPYPPDARWAEPDLDHAAKLLRDVIDDPSGAAERGARGATHVRATRSVAAVGPAVETLVQEARSRHATSVPTWREFFLRGSRSRLLPFEVRIYRHDWLPDGTPVDDAMQRLLYRALWAQQPEARETPPPDPELPGGGGAPAFIEWLREPIVPEERPFVSRYLHEVWRDDPALRERFPDLSTAGVGYLRWLQERGEAETELPRALLPTPDDVARATRVQRVLAARRAVGRVAHGVAQRVTRLAGRGK